MSDVRAAAERLLTNFIDRYYIDGERGDFVADVATVCEAILAEHPSDDATPMTKLWWCDMNGGSRFMFSSDERLMLFLAVDGTIELCVTSGLREISYKLPHIKTRGDVRRLCRALGVEVRG